MRLMGHVLDVPGIVDRSMQCFGFDSKKMLQCTWKCEYSACFLLFKAAVAFGEFTWQLQPRHPLQGHRANEKVCFMTQILQFMHLHLVSECNYDRMGLYCDITVCILFFIMTGCDHVCKAAEYLHTSNLILAFKHLYILIAYI